MLKKGRMKVESPEKMPVATSGIEMTRRTGGASSAAERLTGGNAAADESKSAKLVTDFMLKKNPEA